MQAAVQRQAVDDRAHARARARRSGGCARPGSRGAAVAARPSMQRLVRGRQVGRAADQRRAALRASALSDLARGGAGGDRLVVGGEGRQVVVPAARAARRPERVPDCGRARGPPSRSAAKRSFQAACARRARAPRPRRSRAHLVGHEERGSRGQPRFSLVSCHLVLAERLAVRLGGVLLVGRAVADVRAHAISDGRSVSALAASMAASMASRSLPSHALHVPAVGLEARAHVLGEGQVGAAVDA